MIVPSAKDLYSKPSETMRQIWKEEHYEDMSDIDLEKESKKTKKREKKAQITQ